MMAANANQYQLIYPVIITRIQIRCQEWKKHSRVLLQERSIVAINNTAITTVSRLQLVPRRACINAAIIRSELDLIEVVVLPAQIQEEENVYGKGIVVELGIFQGVVLMMIMELRMDTLDPSLLMIQAQEVNLDQRVHLPQHLLLQKNVN